MMSTFSLQLCAHMCTCTYVNMHIYTNVYHTHMCMCTHTNIHTHVYTHTHTERERERERERQRQRQRERERAYRLIDIHRTQESTVNWRLFGPSLKHKYINTRSSNVKEPCDAVVELLTF